MNKFHFLGSNDPIDFFIPYIDIEKFNIKIHELYLLIRDSVNLSEAERYFFELEDIQLFLSKYLFVYKQIGNDFIINFVNIFERIDDTNYRQYLFNEIKAGRIK
jgi:hypothetical protein